MKIPRDWLPKIPRFSGYLSLDAARAVNIEYIKVLQQFLLNSQELNSIP